MGLLSKLWQAHREKMLQRNTSCDSLISEVSSAVQNLSDFLNSPNNYADVYSGETLLTSQTSLNERIADIKSLKRAKNFKLLKKHSQTLLDDQSLFIENIHIHNQKVAKQRLDSAYQIIGTVEGKKLDEQQMLCMIEPSRNRLVIAGAGTGKTTTIVGKIKWLLLNQICAPEEILVLSFTNASATEMYNRIRDELNAPVEASTFHKLGLNILRAVEGVTPKITTINLRKFIKTELDKLIQSQEYLELLSSYLIYSRVNAKSEFDFSREEDYSDYLQTNPPTTLAGEKVKSYGEMHIGNFFIQNGINYIYEHPYKHDVQTKDHGHYYPDFYLPDFDIYVEYFGIDETGKVPSYFEGRDGKDASEVYRETMEWKRNLHNEKGTTLIECFAYENFKGVLLQNLEKHLKKHDVLFVAKTHTQLLKEMSSGGKSVLVSFIELAETVINLLKSNDYSIATVHNLISTNSPNQWISHSLLDLIDPLYDSYCDILKDRNEIDFNDMINNATKYVKKGKYHHPYKQVIVDEYQDISKSRFSLLKAMREDKDYSLFCVGDDWQSIYRFAGSDIGFILNFKQFWGETAISKIETTYRFSQNLIDISGQFIMQNPNQIKKSIRGNEESTTFPLEEIVGYTESYLSSFLIERLEYLPNNATVFFIGRYSFDIEYLKKTSQFVFSWNRVTGLIDVTLSSRPDLKIQFLTAHKSKGLQADFVFILNNKNSRLGFPSKIQDAPIFDLLLESSDTYKYSEERRLFYVSLTRSRKKVILLTLKGSESVFEIELKSRHGEKIRKESVSCPICGGAVIKKNGRYGYFWGCANFRNNGCTYTRQITTLANKVNPTKNTTIHTRKKA